jgi:hypothetical protein
MPITRLPAIMLFLCLSACSSGLKYVDAGTEHNHGPYVVGMHGVENLTFDGGGALFVTGLDGMIYRVEPHSDPWQGTITARKKLGAMCLGIEVGPDGMVYVGVSDEKGIRRICRMDKSFENITALTEAIPGLNGFEQANGYLYYTSSNESLVCPRGVIYRVKFGAEENFKHPEVVVAKAGMVNGLALSPDQSTLYYTETLGGLWAFNLATQTRKRIYKPAVITIFDDLTTSPDGTIWLCLNSGEAIVAIKDGIAHAAYKVGDLRAPSACAFGKGPGFSPDRLYITEFGLKGRSLTMNGRGVWVLDVTALKAVMEQQHSEAGERDISAQPR